LQVKKKMLIAQNNLLNSSGALLHSTSSERQKSDIEVCFYRKRNYFGFCLCFLGNTYGIYGSLHHRKTGSIGSAIEGLKVGQAYSSAIAI